MSYDIPVIGNYQICESLCVYLNKKEFARSTEIEDAKNKIRASVDTESKRLVLELQQKVTELNSINVGLLDDYRKENDNVQHIR